MGELVHTGSKYDDDTRVSVVTEYAIRGSYLGTARHLGMPESTVRDMVKSDWGQELLAKVREENQDRFISVSQKIIDKATARTLDTIDDADCRTAATVGAIYYDKLRLALQLPTSIRGDTGGVEALAKQFAALSEQWAEKQARVVQVIDQPGKNKA